MANLLNRAAVKRFILKTVAERRPAWGCTRVSRQAIDGIETRLRASIVRMVHCHPSIGKTFLGE